MLVLRKSGEQQEGIGEKMRVGRVKFQRHYNTRPPQYKTNSQRNEKAPEPQAEPELESRDGKDGKIDIHVVRQPCTHIERLVQQLK